MQAIEEHLGTFKTVFLVVSIDGSRLDSIGPKDVDVPHVSDTADKSRQLHMEATFHLPQHVSDFGNGNCHKHL